MDDYYSTRSISSFCDLEPIQPKFQLKGHQEQVIAVGWSSQGKWVLARYSRKAFTNIKFYDNEVIALLADIF